MNPPTCSHCSNFLVEVLPEYVFADSTWKCYEDGITYKLDPFAGHSTMYGGLVEVSRTIEAQGVVDGQGN
jgi:hypothetical protein